MSQLVASDGQPGNWEEPDFFLRTLETVRFQAYGWREPCESRDSRTVLWKRGGEIPLRDPTMQLITDDFIQEKYQLLPQFLFADSDYSITCFWMNLF